MNLKQKVAVSFVLLLGLFACNQKKETKEISKPSVVIFEQALYPLNFKNPFKNVEPIKKELGVISYTIGDSLVYFNPEREKDTLLLNNPKHYAELRFDCLFEDYNYLIPPNDTVLFSVDEYGRPNLKSKTCETFTKLYNFPYKIGNGHSYLYYRLLTGLIEFGSLLATLEKAKTKLPSLYEKFKHAYIPIDTLQKSFLLYQKNYSQKLGELNKQSDIPNEYIDYLNYRYELDDYTFELSKEWCQRGLSEKADATLFFDDKYMTYPSYQEFILRYLRLYFNIKEKIPVNRGKQSTNVDWRKTYERLSEKGYPVKTKHFMQKHALEKMSKLFSAKSIKKYLDDYLLQTGDSTTINAIVNPHRLSVSDKRMAAEKLLLKDMQGKVQTFEQVLEANKGCVLYVDFWASWCVPCMSLMPDSKQLHEKYAGRKIKFLYFSIDEDENAWKAAAKKASIEEKNYLVVNPKEAPIMKELKIQSIPRYMVFDKEGKLVDANAPRPNEGKIETILDKYLAQ